MPDFERLTDRLRVDVATTPEEREWAKGYAAGKTRARIEVAVIFAALYFGIALYGRLAGYHPNGEDAHWDGFPEVAAADEAISAATQYLKA